MMIVPGSLGRLGAIASAIAQWLPSGLFTTGVNGAWYDPSDINLTWRRNLLTYTEQFDNAAWGKLRANITPNAIAAPDGTITAYKVVADTSTNTHGISQLTTTVAGTTYTQSFFAKSGEYRYVYISPAGPWSFQRFDLQTGTVGPLLANFLSASIVSVGNGWYWCSATWVSTAAYNGNYIWIGNSTADAASFAGNGTSGIYIWGAQLEVGSTATPYQRITDGIKDYLDYNPLPILYQDAAGTTPVTAVGQPVGLMLDKSKGLVLGPELVTNGDFSNGTTGWTNSSTGTGSATFSAGQVLLQASGVSDRGQITQTIPTVAGRAYEYRWTRVGGTGLFQTYVGPVTPSLDLFGAAYSAAGSYRAVFIANGTSVTITINSYSAGGVTLDNISVRELPGNHAFNPSGNSANFPVLSARYNLLTKTEKFDDATWRTTAAFTTITGGFTDQNGTNNAFKLVGANKNIYQSISGLTAGTQVGFTIAIKADSSGTVTISNANGGVTPLTCNVTTNWQYFSLPFASVGSNDGPALFTNGTLSTIYAAFPDLRVSNDALNQPAYQRVNTATDYDTVGFKPYLAFNGTNQWLQTNSIDFTYGDKMFVSAGGRKLSDAAFGAIAELSASADANNGSFVVGCNTLNGDNPSRRTWAARVQGTSGNLGGASVFASPDTRVITSVLDIGAATPSTENIMRINGVSQTLTYAPSDAGTGNFGNYPLYIGARGGASLWFNGRLYGLVIAGKAASASEIASTESWLNQKTGAY